VAELVSFNIKVYKIRRKSVLQRFENFESSQNELKICSFLNFFYLKFWGSQNICTYIAAALKPLRNTVSE
jgi:hypothetical protein